VAVPLQAAQLVEFDGYPWARCLNL